MISALPSQRPTSFDVLPASATAISVELPRAEPIRRPKPIEGTDPSARVRREFAAVAGAQAVEIDDESTLSQSHAGWAIDDAPRETHGRLSFGSTAFFAQLLGQDGHARDPVAAGRGHTSFRTSHVERYEEVSSWARRVELIFDFDGMISTVPAA